MDNIAAYLGADMAIDSLAASGQIGSTTKPVYTYDGDPSKVIDVAGVILLVKISDKVYDLNTLVTIRYVIDGKNYTASIAECQVDYQDGIQVLMVPYDSLFGGGTEMTSKAASVPEEIAEMYGITSGTYFWLSADMSGYATYAEFAGEIKPIDPKYLPNPADLPSDWIASLKTALGI